MALIARFLVIGGGPHDGHLPYIELARHLTERGVRAFFLAFWREAAVKMRAAGLDVVALSELVDCRRGAHEPPLNGIADRYGLVSLRELCFPEIKRGRNEDEALSFAAHALEAIEEVFDRVQPSLVVQDSGGELMRRLSFAVARRRHVRHVFIRPTPFKGRVAFSVDSEMGEWTKISSFGPADKQPPEVLARACEFASKYREAMTCITSFNPPAVTKRRLRMALELLRERFITERRSMEPWGPVHRFTNYGARVLKMQLFKPYYAPFPNDNPFLFYPIHHWTDSAILVRARHYVRQDYVIEVLSDALPERYVLCVKEHPVSPGAIPLRCFSTIRSLRNVRLLDPRCSSIDLVRRAAAIVVISSTTGFEGVALHRPVVVLGRPFYAGRGVTIEPPDLFDLPATIHRALHFRPDPDTCDWLVYCAYHSTVPGSMITPGGRMDALAESLCDEFGPRAPAHTKPAKAPESCRAAF